MKMSPVTDDTMARDFSLSKNLTTNFSSSSYSSLGSVGPNTNSGPRRNIFDKRPTPNSNTNSYSNSNRSSRSSLLAPRKIRPHPSSPSSGYQAFKNISSFATPAQIIGPLVDFGIIADVADGASTSSLSPPTKLCKNRNDFSARSPAEFMSFNDLGGAGKFSPPNAAKNLHNIFCQQHSTEWTLSCSDQSSRDSGFESSCSTSSSNRSTPVVVDYVDLKAGPGHLGLKNQQLHQQQEICLWDKCQKIFTGHVDNDESESMAEHILDVHVRPLASPAPSASNGETGAESTKSFACQWRGCKVFDKPSRQYAWLENHVIEKHGGSKPYSCIVDGCRQRFGSRYALERHVNAHFEQRVVQSATSGGGGASGNGAQSLSGVPCTTKNGQVRANGVLVHDNGVALSKIDSFTSPSASASICTSFSSSTDRTASSTFSRCLAAIPGSPGTAATTVNASTNENSRLDDKNHFYHDSFDDDQSIGSNIAWHALLAVTNERLSAADPSRRTSGTSNNNVWGLKKPPKFKEINSFITFQCIILARRRFKDESGDADKSLKVVGPGGSCQKEENFEYFCEWAPEGFLPPMWISEKLYRSTFTIARNLLPTRRFCGNGSGDEEGRANLKRPVVTTAASC